MNIFEKIKFKLNPEVLISSFSIKGRKEQQEDAFFISPRRGDGQLILVADGVGGHNHGDFASKTVVEMFKNFYIESKSFHDIPDFLRKTSLMIAATVYNKGIQDSEYRNSGSTISGFFIEKNTYYTLNIGDSRVYHYINKQLYQITKDHSLVGELVEQGTITEAEAKTHAQRNIMTSAIGQNIETIKIDVEGPFEIKKGEMLLAFSDGVHDYMNNAAINNTINKNILSKNLAEIIVNKAYQAGSKDNITACTYLYY